MKKKNIIIWTISTVVIIYIGGVFLFSQKTFPTMAFNGHHVGMISNEKLGETVKTYFDNQQMSIKDDIVPDYKSTLAELGTSIDSDGLTTFVVEGQKPLFWGINIFQSQDYDVTNYIKVDEDKLKKKLTSDHLLTADGRTASADATQVYDKEGGKYTIKKEVMGNELDENFSTSLVAAIKKGDTEFDATEYYIKPKVISSDLTAGTDKLNSRLERNVSIKFGDKSVDIPKEKVASFIFLDKDGNVDVDNKTLYNYLFKLSSDYDSVAKSGSKRIITSYNVDPAYAQIESGLLADEDTDVVGATEINTFHQDGSQTSIPATGTYIEVSISQQYMWLYNDDKLVLKTPVVTGNAANGWDTPTGTFKVWNKETNKVLDGATVGYDYKVPVDYWMAIDYTGVGIHDIDWLTSSNAEASRNVYKTDGSHGCVNTPNDLMKKVYDNTPLGTSVYVMP